MTSGLTTGNCFDPEGPTFLGLMVLLVLSAFGGQGPAKVRAWLAFRAWSGGSLDRVGAGSRGEAIIVRSRRHLAPVALQTLAPSL